MYFLGEIEHRFGSVDSFSRFYRVIAQSKDSAWRILDGLAASGSIAPYPEANHPLKGSYYGDGGQLVIVDAIREMDATAFYSQALERFPLHSDDSAQPAEDFPAYVKEIARRLGRSLASRETKVEQSVLLHAISGAIGETDWQKLRTKFAGVTFMGLDMGEDWPPALESSAGTDREAALAVARAVVHGGENEAFPEVTLKPGPSPTLKPEAESESSGQSDNEGQVIVSDGEPSTQEKWSLTDWVKALGQIPQDPQSLTLTMLRVNCKVNEGAFGMEAERLTYKYGKPVFIFGTRENGELAGVGRSLLGFSLNQALERIKARHPDIFIRSSAYEASAGVSLKPGTLDTFRDAFEQVALESVGKD